MARGYGHLDGPHEGGGKKKTVAIAGVCSLLLVAMVVAVTVGVNNNITNNNTDSGGPAHGSGNGEIHASVKAIRAICQPTDYKETCQNSLSKVAGNSSDPKELVKVAFKVTVDQVKDVLKKAADLKRAAKDPYSKKALKNCEELMGYAIDDLKTSLKQIGTFDVSKIDEIVEDVKIWLSASETYLETCLDGFEGVKGQTGTKMRKLMKAASELTSNILAIVTEISSVITNMDLQSLFHRRLLESDVPHWVSETGRQLLAVRPPISWTPNVTVAQDGSGNFTTINEAVATIPLESVEKYVIYVREGVYKEQVTIERKMENVVMIGDGPDKTRITGSLNFIDGTPTFKTATVAVVGDGFMARGIGFENTAGAEKHQAVALRVQSDRSVFHNCRMDAYQDTLYFHTKRQFYRDCTISGTIDFMFGNAAVVFQNCQLVVRKPLENQQNIITAQGRKDRREPTAVILHNCTVVAEPDYLPFTSTNPTYLGRPWKQYSRTFYIQSDLGNFINPAGWLPWNETFGLNTCFYAEYGNRGAAAVKTQRVKWRGIKTLTPQRADIFTVARFLGGNTWIPQTGVPYYPSLYPSV